MSETPARTRYELFVGRHVSPATLATFPVALVPTAVPRNTVHRLRVGADSDIAEIVRRLTDCDVELLEIRRIPQGSRWRPRPQGRTDPPEIGSHSDVVVPLPRTGAGLAAAPSDSGEVTMAPISPIGSREAGAPRTRRPRRRARRG